MFSSATSGRALRRKIDIACACMFMLYGYDAGVLGGVLATPQFLHSIFPHTNGVPSGAYDIAMIASSYTLAAFFSTPIVMLIGLKTGRRKLLLLGNVLVIIGAAVQASAYSMGHIIVGRVICGFGIGFISCTVPPYQNEQSIDHSTRGRATAVTCCFLIGGIPIAYWLDYGMSFIDHSVSWRFPIALQALPACIALVVFFSCPDTPRWYYAVGRDAEGDRTLCRLFDLPITDPQVLSEKKAILAAIELEETAVKPKLKDWIWDTSDLKVARRLTVCFCTLSMQQLMSVNFLVYYSTIIFSNNGLSANTSAILGAVLNTLFWIGTIPTIFLIDTVGRRGLMLKTAMVMTVLMAVFVALLGLPVDKQSKATNWAASGLIIVYMFFYGTGWMGPAWQYAPEIAPLELRHIGAALNASGEWLFSFVTVFASPIAVDNPSVGWKIWIWYLVFNALAVPFVYYCCPETANKSLEELDVLYCKPEVRERLLAERSDLMHATAQRAIEKHGLVDPHAEVRDDFESKD